MKNSQEIAFQIIVNIRKTCGSEVKKNWNSRVSNAYCPQIIFVELEYHGNKRNNHTFLQRIYM